MVKHSHRSTPDSNQQTPSSDDEGSAPGSQNAIDLIRDKLARAYSSEPDANDEMDEATQSQDRSKHQQFMYELGVSGKDLATIQTEWHNYYQKLPDNEKHQVWQEFYASQSKLTHQTSRTPFPASDAHLFSEHKHTAAKAGRTKPPKLRDVRTTKDIQEVIKHNVTAGGKLEVKHQVQSLLFGLGMGLLVVFIFMFGFFNEVFIAPFIQPSRVSANTPLIVNSTVAPTPNPEVIIPKINVEIPVDYSVTTTDESVIENDLQNGVVHYPTTVLPGQDGNTAYFGHSSNNIFNHGKYKFAFVLLHTLVNGDTFYLTNNSKIYVYKVISHTIVSPNDVGVLGPVAGQTATATLITCDPPGTSINRLIVVGQQISPDPSGNTQTVAPTATATLPSKLPADGQTLWGRFITTMAGKVMVTVIVLLAVVYALRAFHKRAIRYINKGI
jgi:LPXTG-site transpeptidase (sortase) family protein